MVREAKLEDLAGILHLYQHLFPQEDYTHTREFQELWQHVNDRSTIFKYFVAEELEQIVATCCITIIPNLTRKRRPYALIENVITHPRYRKKGFGSQVVRMAIEHARTRQCYKIMLLSDMTRQGAHAFYRSLGFDDEAKKGFLLRIP